MNRDLAALVVHDLKNELGGLESQLAHLAAGSADPGAAQAHRACADLRRRFVQFLMLYGQDQRLCAHTSDEAPLDLLEAAASHARETLPPGIEVAIADGWQAPSFWYLDPRLVRMALDAALHNAARFARQRIELQALRDDEGCLVLRVDDDGAGLGSADPQADHATGLGTALCRAVAAAHRHAGRHGDVRLLPRPGGGARFELVLP